MTTAMHFSHIASSLGKERSSRLLVEESNLTLLVSRGLNLSMAQTTEKSGWPIHEGYHGEY